MVDVKHINYTPDVTSAPERGPTSCPTSNTFGLDFRGVYFDFKALLKYYAKKGRIDEKNLGKLKTVYRCDGCYYI